VNGFSADDPNNIDSQLIKARLDDIAYLKNSIEKLQTHLDVKRILVISACVPGRGLYFGKTPEHVDDHIYPDYALASDTEMKVTHWAFGSVNTITQNVQHNVTYMNNPYIKGVPYWPKRISIDL
jgi:hypothetical protein